MLFLFSLVIAAAFSVFCGKAIRKYPAPFYLTAAVLSIGTAILANMRIPEIPAFVQQNIIALFSKGILNIGQNILYHFRCEIIIK